MAELVVSDNLSDSEIGVRDSLHRSQRQLLVDPIIITATPRNCPPGSELVLQLPDGLYLVPGQHAYRGVVDGSQTAWEVTLDPRAAPARLTYSVRLQTLSGPLATTRRTIVATIYGATGFEPSRDGFSFVDSPHLFGTVEPTRAIFVRSFLAGLHSFVSRRVFNRIYRSIFRCGALTGLSMTVLWLFVNRTNASTRDVASPGQNTRVLIDTFHGRQISDAALLRSGLDLVRNSPAAMFQELRRATLELDKQPVAFNVGVPIIYRWDFLRVVMRQGRTIVPYSYRIVPGHIAEIAVYDPGSIMEGAILPTPLLFIDLLQDTYAYGSWSSLEPGNRTTITLARLTTYSRPRACLIAILVSLVLRTKKQI